MHAGEQRPTVVTLRGAAALRCPRAGHDGESPPLPGAARPDPRSAGERGGLGSRGGRSARSSSSGGCWRAADDSNGEQGGLPRELLADVLALVPLADRLRAALACSDWRDAAAAATTSIDVKQAMQPRADSLAAWLGARGGQVARLEVQGVWDALGACPSLALPCEALVRLEALRLKGVDLETPGGAGLVPLAGQLTSLELDWCGLPLPAVELLGALTRLRRLELELDGDAANSEEMAALAAAVGGLTQLTRLNLNLDECSLTGEAAATPVSGLAALAELRLQPEGAASVQMPRLPTSLTWLELNGLQLPPAALAACTGLRHLDLGGCNFSAPGGELLAAVGACTQLEQLTIWGLGDEQLPAVAWAPLAALSENVDVRGTRVRAAAQADVDGLAAACPALRELAVEYGGFGSLDTPEPLSLRGLLALTRLTRLQLLHGSLDGQPAYVKVDDAQAVTVLARLTGLRELEMERCCYDLTPAGALHLTALRRLSSLRVWLDDDNDRTFLTSQAPAGAPPDVWRQLQARCAQW
ncbi:hypothetical protein HT031_005592 [Scenedesmus sp. PABB004]|nr:hypothetical protein HT031_005592 [Scenedesmus sp. PABB004]